MPLFFFFFPPAVSHPALAQAGARLASAQEPPALALTPAHPRGNLLRRLLLPLRLRRGAATPQFLQAFLSGHRCLTHNGYRHRNQAVPPLLSRLHEGFFSAGTSLCFHLTPSSLKPPTGAVSVSSQEEKAEKMRQMLEVERCYC